MKMISERTPLKILRIKVSRLQTRLAQQNSWLQPLAPAWRRSIHTESKAKADELHELIVGNCFGYLSGQLFRTVCANLAYRPAQTLDNISQITEVANDNKVLIPMNDFFIKIYNSAVILSPDFF